MDNMKFERGGGHNRNCQFAHLVRKFGRDIDSAYQAKVKAFTLAEVLITLVIIGVVAALTIPSVIINYQKKTYVTQLQKRYNELNNAFRQMMAKDGVTKLSDTKLWSLMPSGGLTASTLANNSELMKEFSKTFNVMATYTSENKPDNLRISYGALKCPPSATKCFSASDTEGIYFNDGNSFLYISFIKNPGATSCGSKKCTTLKEYQAYRNTPTKLWQYIGQINLDVNGPKKPNVWGRDMFWFYVGNDGVLYPYGGKDIASYSCDYSNLNSCQYYWRNVSAERYSCSNDNGIYSYGYGCAARIMEESWQMNY